MTTIMCINIHGVRLHFQIIWKTTFTAEFKSTCIMYDTITYVISVI